MRAAWVDLHSQQVAETGSAWRPIENLIQNFERELDDGDHTKVRSSADVQDRAKGVDGTETGNAAGRADRAGANDAAVQPGESSAAESGATGARGSAANQPVVVTKKRRVIERSDDGAPNSRGASDAKQLTAEFAKFLRVGSLGRKHPQRFRPQCFGSVKSGKGGQRPLSHCQRVEPLKRPHSVPGFTRPPFAVEKTGVKASGFFNHVFTANQQAVFQPNHWAGVRSPICKKMWRSLPALALAALRLISVSLLRFASVVPSAKLVCVACRHASHTHHAGSTSGWCHP